MLVFKRIPSFKGFPEINPDIDLAVTDKSGMESGTDDTHNVERRSGNASP